MTASAPLEIAGPAAPPRSNGELVFAEPWESRAFGLAVTLYDAGAFEWSQFQAALIAQIAAWAAEHGYEALEVATWPSTGSREFEASHIDVAAFDKGDAERIRALFDQHGLEISALAFFADRQAWLDIEALLREP